MDQLDYIPVVMQEGNPEEQQPRPRRPRRDARARAIIRQERAAILDRRIQHIFANLTIMLGLELGTVLAFFVVLRWYDQATDLLKTVPLVLVEGYIWILLGRVSEELGPMSLNR